MHYSERLKAEIQAREDRIAAALDTIIQFRTYLVSEKFQGICENYIATHEVHSWVDRISDDLFGEE